VLAQRLVRKLCPHCGTHTQGQPPGCQHCGYTGYQGRTGVFELMVANDRIRELIHNRAAEADIRSAALEAGMTLMRDDGQRLVRERITTTEEVLRVTRD
jgi:general secretion pathway protein E